MSNAKDPQVLIYITKIPIPLTIMTEIKAELAIVNISRKAKIATLKEKTENQIAMMRSLGHEFSTNDL